jgi:GT2 family glycosyltransferase
MSTVPVSVAIVTWNSSDVIDVSLAALQSTSPRPTEVVIVDNASADETVARVRDVASRATVPIRLEVLDRNTGFAAGMNRAIAHASNDHVLLLNPDVSVTASLVGRLHEVLEAAGPDVYAVGPKLLRASGSRLDPTTTIDSTGIRMTRDGRHLDRGSEEPDRGQFDMPGEVFGLTGAAVLIRRNLVETAAIDGQMFDEDFFAYREDADLAWRMRGFGYRALFEPSAVAFHRRHVTPGRRRALSPEINRHSVKNRFLLRIHHADRGWLVRFGLRSLARDVVVIGASVTIERSSLSAFPWLVRHFRTHLRRRREILARRRVSSRELARWFA